MSGQQLLLSWKDHNDALVSVFKNLLKKNTLVDCTLAAEGQYLKAHKVVLSACSSYFELLFSQESEKNPIVILKDVKFQELEAAINFMYRGEVEVCEDRLAAFLEVADSLQIKGLGGNGKSQDCKGKVSSVKCSSTKPAVTQRQQSRKEESSSQSDNADQISNVPADCEQIRNNESCSVRQSSRRGSSPAVTVSTFNVGSSSCTVGKETYRDSDSLENIQQSLMLPSFSSGESIQSQENPVIKTEPETVTISDDQSNEADGDYRDDVTMMDDQDDWDEPNTETMDAVPTNLQDIGYPSEHMRAENSTSENIESLQRGNQSSTEGASWILPDNQPNFSSITVKDEPGTSAVWNQEVVDYGASASSDVAESSAGMSTASGEDTVVVGCNEQPTPASVLFFPPEPGCSRTNLSGKSVDASLLSLKKIFKPISGALPCILEGKLPPKNPSLSQLLRLQRTHQRSPWDKFVKCSDCDYVTSRPSSLRTHLRIHTGEKPFRCSHCDYASGDKSNVVQHLRTHTGEQPFKCTVCGAKFRTSKSLIRHQRSAHFQVNFE